MGTVGWKTPALIAMTLVITVPLSGCFGHHRRGDGIAGRQDEPGPGVQRVECRGPSLAPWGGFDSGTDPVDTTAVMDVDSEGFVGPRQRRAPFSPRYVARRLSCNEVRAIAEEVAPRHGIEPGLLFGIMRVESAFVANAISRAAAVGLSQVRTTVASRLGCKDLFDPRENADCGARVLARFLKYYGGNLMLALSGYNAGHGMPGNAKREERTPANLEYVENVLRARARYLRAGCKPWEPAR